MTIAGRRRRMAATAALTAHFSRPWNTENKSCPVVTQSG